VVAWLGKLLVLMFAGAAIPGRKRCRDSSQVSTLYVDPVSVTC
jgi:hypothetical protein